MKKAVQLKEVVIIGGGVVGVELAAEVCTHFSDKEVTLVHSKEKLMERTPGKAQQYALDFLQKRGVQVILQEKVTHHEGRHYVTDKGKNITSDWGYRNRNL